MTWRRTWGDYRRDPVCSRRAWHGLWRHETEDKQVCKHDCADYPEAASWASDLEGEGQADGIETECLHAQENGGHIKRAAVRACPQAVHNGVPCIHIK